MILAREAIAVWEIQLALADTHTLQNTNTQRGKLPGKLRAILGLNHLTQSQ